MRGGLRRRLVEELKKKGEYLALVTAFYKNPTPENYDALLGYISDAIDPDLEEGDLEKLQTFIKQQLQEHALKFEDFVYYELSREDLPDAETCKDVMTLDRAPGGTPMTYYYRIDQAVDGYKLRIGAGSIGCMTTANYTAWDKAVVTGAFDGNPYYGVTLSRTGARDETGAFVGPSVKTFSMPPAPSGGRRAKKTRRSAKSTTTRRRRNRLLHKS